MFPLLPVTTLAILLAPMASGADVDTLARQEHWVEAAWPNHSQLLRKPAPPLVLSDWINGEVSAEQRKGKVVVVDFWATWCGPCRASIPHNNELLKKYASQGVLLVGVCCGGGEDKMAEVAQTFGIQYPTAKAAASVTAAWKVSYWPTYAILDRKGELRALGVRPGAVEGLVEALLAER